MDEPRLPEGYQFADPRSITVKEVDAIRHSVGWMQDDPHRWRHCLDSALEVCGVRTKEGALVGIGFLTGSYRHAVLCDFNVHKDHQRKGLGKAIIAHRMKRADELKIPYLYISLAAENPLRNLYQQLGFKAVGDLMIRENTVAKAAR